MGVAIAGARPKVAMLADREMAPPGCFKSIERNEEPCGHHLMGSGGELAPDSEPAIELVEFIVMLPIGESRKRSLDGRDGLPNLRFGQQHLLTPLRQYAPSKHPVAVCCPSSC